MAKLTILNFIEWAVRQMNASDLSQLMFAYGYTRDDAETVLQALNDNKPLFREYFAKALYQGLDRPKSYYDLNREQGEMNAYEWISYAEKNELILATGNSTKETTTDTSNKKFGWREVLSILGFISSTTESIYGGKKAGEYLTQYQLQAEAERSARQTTTVAIALVIIVVIIAGVVIMTKRK